VHRFGILWNHFIELIVPFFAFWPRILRIAAGILMISFHFILILSGNLSFLNWVTIVPLIACFDDQFLKKFMSKKIVHKAQAAAGHSYVYRYEKAVVWGLVVIVSLLSIPVVQNLISSNQAMNFSFNRLNLVNTYGAFGSVGNERYELVLEGAQDNVITADTEWKEYDFKGKPTDVYETPPIIAPYQPRVDWQIWFAAMQRPEYNPWLLNMIWKLLENDSGTLSLLEKNPFPNEPPKHIRVLFYRYKFAPLNNKEGKVWEREYIGVWLAPLSKETQGFYDYLKASGLEP
jgi:hypothetical protein